MTIEERIKEIEGRLDKAEGGKWTVRGSTVACGEFGVIASNGRGGNVREFVEQGNRNMEFIAHSKDDITFLLSELKRCREALEEISTWNVLRSDMTESMRANVALHPEGVK